MSEEKATLSGAASLDLPEFDAPPADPLPLAWRWLADAPARGISEPYAATLATADASGMPSARVLLVKDWDERGLVFTTSRTSGKGEDLAVNPQASLTFFWRETIQQLRLWGAVEALPADASDALFAQRPVPAQAASAASEQSRPLTSEDALRERVASLLASGPLARPADWTGYRLVPTGVEFWCGSPDRLHRRLRYERDAEGGPWSARRLQP